jgi:type IV pilus assembly protein PilQ
MATTAGRRAPRTVGGGLGNTGQRHDRPGVPVRRHSPATAAVNLPRVGLNGSTPAQFSFILFNQQLTRFLNLELSALEADGKGKIIASPRVLTADQVEALIEQGTEIPTSRPPPPAPRRLPSARPTSR